MFKKWHLQFFKVIQNFWFPLLFAFATFILSSFVIYTKDSFSTDIGKMALYLSLGISLGFGIEFIELQSKKAKDLTKALVCVFIFLEVIWSLSFDSRKFLYTFINVFLLSHLFVALSFWFNTKIQKTEGQERLNLFWKKNWDLFMSFQASLLVNGVLYVGLIIAFVSINSLFKIQFDKIYFYLFSFLATVGGTFYLGLSLLDTKDEENKDSKILLTLVNFIFPTLQLIYFGILYIYLGKILIEQNLPRGYVGWLVSCLSVLVCLSHLIIRPNVEKGIVKPFSQWIWRFSFIAMIPLLVLLSIGIFRRVSEYGFTESRYLLLCLHLWMYAMAFYHFHPRKAKMQIIPLSLFALTLVTSLGPLSPNSIAFWSQKSRLQEPIRELKGKWENNQLVFPADAPIESQKKMLTTLYYVCKVYGVKKIYSMLDLQTTETWSDYEDTSCYFQSGNNYTTNKPFATLIRNFNLSIIEDAHFALMEAYGPTPILRMENSNLYQFDIADNQNVIPDLKMEIDNIYIYQNDNKKQGKKQLIFHRIGQEQIQWTPEKGSLKTIDLKPLMEKLSRYQSKSKDQINPLDYILKIENENSQLTLQFYKINFQKLRWQFSFY